MKTPACLKPSGTIFIKTVRGALTLALLGLVYIPSSHAVEQKIPTIGGTPGSSSYYEDWAFAGYNEGSTATLNDANGYGINGTWQIGTRYSLEDGQKKTTSLTAEDTTIRVGVQGSGKGDLLLGQSSTAELTLNNTTLNVAGYATLGALCISKTEAQAQGMEMNGWDSATKDPNSFYAREDGGNGTLNVKGTSSFNVAKNLILGARPGTEGTINVSDSGKVNIEGYLQIGQGDGSNKITNNGQEVIDDQAYYLTGAEGSPVAEGTLNLTNGAHVTAIGGINVGYVKDNNDGTGSLYGTGTVNISDTAKLSTSGVLQIWNNSTVTVASTGTLTSNGLYIANDATLNLSLTGLGTQASGTGLISAGKTGAAVASGNGSDITGGLVNVTLASSSLFGGTFYGKSYGIIAQKTNSFYDNRSAFSIQFDDASGITFTDGTSSIDWDARSTMESVLSYVVDYGTEGTRTFQVTLKYNNGVISFTKATSSGGPGSLEIDTNADAISDLQACTTDDHFNEYVDGSTIKNAAGVDVSNNFTEDQNNIFLTTQSGRINTITYNDDLGNEHIATENDEAGATSSTDTALVGENILANTDSGSQWKVAQTIYISQQYKDDTKKEITSVSVKKALPITEVSFISKGNDTFSGDTAVTGNKNLNITNIVLDGADGALNITQGTNLYVNSITAANIQENGKNLNLDNSNLVLGGTLQHTTVLTKNTQSSTFDHNVVTINNGSNFTIKNFYANNDTTYDSDPLLTNTVNFNNSTVNVNQGNLTAEEGVNLSLDQSIINANDSIDFSKTNFAAKSSVINVASTATGTFVGANIQAEDTSFSAVAGNTLNFSESSLALNNSHIILSEDSKAILTNATQNATNSTIQAYTNSTTPTTAHVQANELKIDTDVQWSKLHLGSAQGSFILNNVSNALALGSESIASTATGNSLVSGQLVFDNAASIAKGTSLSLNMNKATSGSSTAFDTAALSQGNTWQVLDLSNSGTMTGTFSSILGQINDGTVFKIKQGSTYGLKEGEAWDLSKLYTDGIIGITNATVVVESDSERYANTMWSALSGVKAYSATGLGHLDDPREHCYNYWASGLGKWDRISNHNSVTGYDFNSYGYAVGTDSYCLPNTILGISFGQMWGSHKPNRDTKFASAGEIKESNRMAMIYGRYFIQESRPGRTYIDGYASYGRVSNKSTRYTIFGANDDLATAKWDTDVFNIGLKGTKEFALDDRTNLKPFIGLDYAHGSSEDIIESSPETQSTFQGMDIATLDASVGVGLERIYAFNNGMKLRPNIALSYVGQVYRDMPSCAVTSTMGSIEERATNTGRNALRAEAGLDWKINLHWAITSDYTFEARSGAVEHRADIGANYTF